MAYLAGLSHRALVPWVLLCIPLIVFFALFVTPMMYLLIQSFFTFDPNSGIHPGFEIDNYKQIIYDPFNLEVLVRTLKIGGITVVASLLVGFPVAYYMSRLSGNWRTICTIVLVSPLLVSVVVRTFGWIVILGNNGPLNNLLIWLGVIESPIRMLFTEGAVIVGLTHIYYPFMTLAILSSLDQIDPNVMRAASSLGGRPLRRAFSILIPLSMPGILSGSLVVFTLSAGAFITPAMLGGGRVRVMAYMAFEQTLVVFNWPRAAALGFVLLLVFLILSMAYSFLLQRGRFRGAFEGR